MAWAGKPRPYVMEPQFVRSWAWYLGGETPPLRCVHDTIRAGLGGETPPLRCVHHTIRAGGATPPLRCSRRDACRMFLVLHPIGWILHNVFADLCQFTFAANNVFVIIALPDSRACVPTFAVHRHGTCIFEIGNHLPHSPVFP